MITKEFIKAMKKEMYVGRIGKYVPPYTEGSGRKVDEVFVDSFDDKFVMMKSVKGGYNLCYTWVELCMEIPAVKFSY